MRYGAAIRADLEVCLRIRSASTIIAPQLLLLLLLRAYCCYYLLHCLFAALLTRLIGKQLEYFGISVDSKSS